jgi:hypothetical protein
MNTSKDINATIKKSRIQKWKESEEKPRRMKANAKVTRKKS